MSGKIWTWRVGSDALFKLALGQEPGWAKKDGEGEMFCVGETEYERAEIGCSGEEEETQAVSKGCKKFRTGATAWSRARELIVGTCEVRHTCIQGHELHRAPQGDAVGM